MQIKIDLTKRDLLLDIGSVTTYRFDEKREILASNRASNAESNSIVISVL
jgi:hypothetical protein